MKCNANIYNNAITYPPMVSSCILKDYTDSLPDRELTVRFIVLLDPPSEFKKNKKAR